MRVLIVEDEERLAENIAAALREGPGYAVDIAGDGETGAYLAERGEYDLIVLDLMLPKVSGPDVLQRLRKKGQKAPVLVLTAITSKASIVELLNSGADDYVGKPFDLGELIARVKALIRRGKGVSHPLIRVGDLEVDTVERCGAMWRRGSGIVADGVSHRRISEPSAERDCIKRIAAGASV